MSDYTRKKGDSALITQVAPGVFPLDLAFTIHAGVDEATVYGGLPLGTAIAK